MVKRAGGQTTIVELASTPTTHLCKYRSITLWNIRTVFCFLRLIFYAILSIKTRLLESIGAGGWWGEGDQQNLFLCHRRPLQLFFSNVRYYLCYDIFKVMKDQGHNSRISNQYLCRKFKVCFLIFKGYLACGMTIFLMLEYLYIFQSHWRLF